MQLVVDLASHVFGDVHWESVDLGDCGVVEEAGVGRGYGLGDVVMVLGWGVWDALVRHGDAGDARDEVEFRGCSVSTCFVVCEMRLCENLKLW